MQAAKPGNDERAACFRTTAGSSSFGKRVVPFPAFAVGAGLRTMGDSIAARREMKKLPWKKEDVILCRPARREPPPVLPLAIAGLYRKAALEDGGSIVLLM